MRLGASTIDLAGQSRGRNRSRTLELDAPATRPTNRRPTWPLRIVRAWGGDRAGTTASHRAACRLGATRVSTRGLLPTGPTQANRIQLELLRRRERSERHPDSSIWTMALREVDWRSPRLTPAALRSAHELSNSERPASMRCLERLSPGDRRTQTRVAYPQALRWRRESSLEARLACSTDSSIRPCFQATVG